MVKSIIKRIIVGVGIVLILSMLKGSLIADVNAMSVVTRGTANNTNIASCQNCSIIDGDLSGYTTGIHNTGAYIHFNVAITSSNNSGALISTLVLSRLTVDNSTYSCSINGLSNNNITSAQNPSLTQAIYSLSCPVQFKSGGLISHIYVQVNGSTPSYLSVYSPFTVVYDDGNQSVIDAIEDNTNAQNDTNDILNNNDVSTETNSSINSTLGSKTEQETFGPVADLILLPLTLFRSFYNGFNGSCSSFDLGTLFNTHLVLPCINLRSILGNSLYSIIDVAISLFMIYNIVLMCIHIFDKITSFKDPFEQLFKPGGGF